MLLEKLRLPLYLIIIVVASTKVAKAQDFKPGFYINQSNEKVEGYFDFSLFNTPQEFTFKESLEGPSRIIDANEIRTASIDKIRFETATIQFNALEEKLYAERPDAKFDQGLRVIQVILDGSVSLYMYEDENGNDNFYLKKANELVLLVNQQYQMESTTGDVLNQQISQYKGQLLEILGDCNELRTKFSTIAYNKNKLIQLVKSYLDCQGLNPPTYIAKNKLNINLEALAGIHLANIDFTGDVSTPTNRTSFAQSTGATFGIGLWTPLTPDEKLMINASILYTDIKTSGNTLDIFTSMRSRETESYIELSHIKVSIIPHYQLLSGDINLSIGAGVSWGGGSEKRNEQIDKQIFGSGISLIEGSVYSQFDQIEIGYLGSLSANYKDFSLTLRYELGSGFSRDLAINSSTKRTYAILGYKIF